MTAAPIFLPWPADWQGQDFPLPPPLPAVADLHDAALATALRRCIDSKTVPQGALGQMATLAQTIGQVLGSTQPHLEQPQLLVFAADHGIARQGVSAYPPEVTAQMVGNFLAGGATVSVLARQHGIAQTVVDCGVCHTFAPVPGLLLRKVAWGSADSSQAPAMTAAQCAQALHQGAALVQSLPGNAILLGEMGIGNTSAAALLVARLAGLPLQTVVGAGTGLDAQGQARKAAVLAQALALHEAATNPFAALAALGGLEIATMVGSVLQAAHERRLIVVDGFIASAAVLVASRLAPHCLQRCVFAHCSDERGHAPLLQVLGAQALLQLNLRVGEGSGAALAWPLLESACRLLREVASFDSAGVANKAV